jgi:5-methyltetrahydropteroyltriglutamate--homocysteine methyltransferase
LKFAVETFWKDTSNTEELAKLQDVAKAIRAKNWAEQASRGMDYVTVGDFAWYDHVLGTLSLLGAIPTRHGYNAKELTLQQYFIMARGSPDMFAMEMTKWFDTNYHYLAPEWTADTVFNGGCNWLYEEIAEAHALGHKVKVVITGPLTLLYLGKIKSGLQHKLDLLPACVAGYASVLAKLKAAGVAWVQIDEPILAFELEKEWLEKFAPTYATLKAVAPSLLLATYFDSVAEHKDLLYSLPVAGIHIDCVRGASQLSTFVAGLPQDKILSVGIVSGRNIWRADLDVALATLKSAQAVIGDRLWVASSCSLLHVPVDLSNEVKLDAEIKSWMAYGFQKITEVSLLKQALDGGDVKEAFAAARASRVARTTSPRVTHPPVQERVKGVTPAFAERTSPFATRIAKQQAKYNYPAFPTTTIGSFPQTKEIRSARAQYKSGKLSSADYKAKMFGEIDLVVRKQEEIGLDGMHYYIYAQKYMNLYIHMYLCIDVLTYKKSVVENPSV